MIKMWGDSFIASNVDLILWGLERFVCYERLSYFLDKQLMRFVVRVEIENGL